MILISFALLIAEASQSNENAIGAPQIPASEMQQGSTATSVVGRAGQRQTRETAAQVIGMKPIDRIDNRIENRVQSRIQSRIDRYYIPQADFVSSFKLADDKVRKQER